ncbi:MAG: hypothetical protein KKC51_06430 [Verrucomicrobia bacterium]|nr:hypothetical protein [Verrucomicrobiota bacterium]
MKTIRPRKNGGRAGSALVTMMIVLLLVCMASAALVGFARQQTHAMGRARDYMKAQSYAEAGANEAYSLLKTNFGLRNEAGAFPATDYEDGGYDATVTPVGNAMALITSVGHCGPVLATVMIDVKNFNYREPGSEGGGPEGAYGYAVVSDDLMTWSGSGTMAIGGGGKIHSNNRYKMSGSEKIYGNVSSCDQFWTTGSTEIYGDAAAPTWKGKSPDNVHGTATTGPVALVPLPPIDLTPYYQHALANGQVYNGNQHFMGSADLAPAGGIMWVNGNLQWSGSGQLIGCFIATGDVKLSGSGDQIKVEDFPAVISRDGDIDISGSGKFHGLIYAITGEFDKSGSGDVVGSIFCAGEFDKSGSWSLMTYEDSTPTAPGDSTPGTEGDLVGVTAWQK